MKTKKQKLEVHVTSKHIKQGRPGEAQSCPIALALIEQTKLNPEVGSCILKLLDNDGIAVLEIVLPARASNFVRKFDGNEPVKPFSFKIPCPHQGRD